MVISIFIQQQNNSIMAANKSVIVLMPNGRRQNVKVTPNTTILQILEEACQKHGYNVDDYDVKHFNQVLDPNAILRFTGLANNAQLELVPCTKTRSTSNIVIGVQLENGQRLMGEFKSSATLTEVLHHLSLDQNLEKAVLIYMHREVYGIDVFEKTTLKSLGLNSGRAMLRLIYREVEQLKYQAHIATPLTPKLSKTENIDDACASTSRRNDTPLPSCSHKTLDPISLLKMDKIKNADTVDLKSMEKNKEEKVVKKLVTHNADPNSVRRIGDYSNQLATDNKCVSRNQNSSQFSQGHEEITTHKIEFLGERNAVLFNQAGAEALPKDELPDNFYDLTVDDAKVLLRDAKRRREELEEAPLLTDAQRQLNEQKRVLNHLHKYQYTVIRVQFPDQFVLQGLFKPLETVQAVKIFIKNYLIDPHSEFTVYTTPPKHVLNSDARLVDENLVPSAIIHYSGSSALKPDIKQKLTDPKDALIQAVKIRMSMQQRESKRSNEEVNTANNNSTCNTSDNKSLVKNEKKVPE